MSAEDSDCSIGLSDFEEEEDDGVSVIVPSGEDSDSSQEDSEEDSCGFFSDEDQLDENWNKKGQGVKRGRRKNDSKEKVDRKDPDSDWVIEGKCALCTNLEGVNEDDLEERCQSSTADSWCKCGQCKVVSYHMKKYDRICCHEISGVVDFIQSEQDRDDEQKNECPDHVNRCITLHPNFTSDVLEYGALYRVHNSSQSSDDTESSSGLSTPRYRKNRAERQRAHNAHCSFIRWIWKHLGYGHRVMPPACVIAKIRQVHMASAPFWYYQNFIPGKFRCEFGKHCVAAAKDTYNIK